MSCTDLNVFSWSLQPGYSHLLSVRLQNRRLVNRAEAKLPVCVNPCTDNHVGKHFLLKLYDMIWTLCADRRDVVLLLHDLDL